MRLLFLIVIFSSGSVAFAHAPSDGDIRATLGTFTYKTQMHDRSPFLLGPALLAEADIDHNGGLEIGMFYLRNSFSIQKQGLTYTERVKRMYITMGYRHWLAHWISAAAAFSSSYSMGDAEIVRDDFGAIPHIGTSARDVTEYGFDFSIQFEPWSEGRYAAIIDLRYDLSVTPKSGEESNHYGAFIGLKYYLQAREDTR